MLMPALLTGLRLVLAGTVVRLTQKITAEIAQSFELPD